MVWRRQSHCSSSPGENGKPRFFAHLYFSYRTGQFVRKNAYPALCQKDERYQQETLQPEGCCGAVRGLVQLLPCSSNPSRNSRDGSRNYRSCLESCSTAWGGIICRLVDKTRMDVVNDDEYLFF